MRVYVYVLMLMTAAYASEVWRTFIFLQCTGPRARNSLPSSLHELTDTGTFKRHLKTFSTSIPVYLLLVYLNHHARIFPLF